ncbi:MAG: pyridoxine 5'-phosphate synthase [Candidatus Aureabacteria bacterium]|nr:pyridoxine 5'-phosphate synthase [Candidatus Auribacterota bacterium]
MIKLGVNIDHVATIRQARGGKEPNPLEAAFICEKALAHSITVHLREDRRHIQPQDVASIKEHVLLPLNLEMALSSEIIRFALKIKPRSVTLVPEKRKELTTEGGLDVIENLPRIRQATKQFKKERILVSLFINPVKEQVEASAKSGAEFIELHTGDYANAATSENRNKELEKLKNAASYALKLGLNVNAGHGLNYTNVRDILSLPGLQELNIGHSIISRAVMVGLEQAVRDMLALMNQANS